MTHRVERKKWILYRHTRSFDLITAVAANLKYFSKTSISSKNKKNLLLKLKELSFYKGRNPKLPLDSINHRINTLAYYMFGYKDKIDGDERFLFSPLGNLFLKYLGKKNEISKIFLTMLWGLQFQHPHGGSDQIFQLYPFRLIFKLLSEPRIEKKLSAFEVAYILVFIEDVDKKVYEKVVSEILEIRNWDNEEIIEALQKDQHVYVNSIYEWDYYVSELLEDAGLIIKTRGEMVYKLRHGKNTIRKLSRNFVQLNPLLHDFVSILLQQYPFFEKPLRLDDPERLKIDVIKQIYNFYPPELLSEIGETRDHLKHGLLNLAQLIEKYSNNNEGAEAYLFEDILTDGFNMFINVDAKKIGGAGNADLECLYTTKKKKFAVDAKSTKNKLAGLNAGRLAQHRQKIGGEYTIVVTPRYVPAVLHDIESSPVVIIRASTFSEYLYNHIDNEVRNIDYSDFDDIIAKNLGKDISKYISQLTLEKFSVKNTL